MLIDFLIKYLMISKLGQKYKKFQNIIESQRK